MNISSKRTLIGQSSDIRKRWIAYLSILDRFATCPVSREWNEWMQNEPFEFAFSTPGYDDEHIEYNNFIRLARKISWVQVGPLLRRVDIDHSPDEGMPIP